MDVGVSTKRQSRRSAVSKKPRKLKLHRASGFGEVSNPFRAKQGFAYQVDNLSGPELAISKVSQGDPAVFDGGVRRGGAHNRGDRQSYGLTEAQVGNLIAAAVHAIRIGLPLNRMMTIHWEAQGVPERAMAKATGHFLDLVTKTLARRGLLTAWVWVHESGDGKGGHCHMLIHLPAGVAKTIAAKQRRWLRAISGHPYRERVILSRPIGGRVGLEDTNPVLYGENLKAAMSYLLKGAHPRAAQIYDIQRYEPGGRVTGKRCGTSQNVGPKARGARVLGR